LDLPLKIKHNIESSKSNFKFDDILATYIDPYIQLLYTDFIKSELYIEMIMKFSVGHQKMSSLQEYVISPRHMMEPVATTNLEEKSQLISIKSFQWKGKKKETENEEEWIDELNGLYQMMEYQILVLDKIVVHDDDE
jgi:hypothetical protein